MGGHSADFWLTLLPLHCYTSPKRRTYMNPQHEYNFTVLFEPAQEGGYVVTCPALPGLVSEGETLQEAREMAKEAIVGYLESLRKDGLPIPTDPQSLPTPVKEEITVSLETA